MQTIKFTSWRRGITLLAALLASLALGLPGRPAQAAGGYSFLFAFGSYGTGDGQFNQPWSVTVDPATGNIIVGDTNNRFIKVFNSSGAFVEKYRSDYLFYGAAAGPTTGTVIVPAYEGSWLMWLRDIGMWKGVGGASCGAVRGFDHPMGVAYDPTSGHIAVADTGGNCIQMFAADGTFLRWSFGADTSYGVYFNHPRGVAFDPTSGRIAVADTGNYRVQLFTADATYLSELVEFDHPMGVAFDPTNGNLVVADTGNSLIQVFNSSGAFLTQFGRLGPVDGRLLDPTGVAVHPITGNIIVADSYLNCIKVYAPIGVARKLGFVQQPSGAMSGSGISPAITVAVLDVLGNTMTADNSTQVTLAITAGAGMPGAVLSGTTTVTVSNGIATFPGLSIDIAGAYYQLTASSAGLISANSNVFPITASKLVYTTTPVTTTAGKTFNIVVEAQDATNAVDSNYGGPVSLAVSGGGGGSLLGTTSVNAVGGVATFTGLHIDQTGTGYVMTASSGTLPQAVSSPFDITVGGADKLGFIQQPTTTMSGSGISPAITVAVQNALGNTMTADNSTQVTLAITAGAGMPGAVLSGTITATVSNGIATFPGLSIDIAGAYYQLTASSAGLISANSNVFPITASKLVYTTTPVTTTAGTTFNIVVEALDATNAIDGNYGGPVSLAVSGGGGGSLLGTTSVDAVGGVATFTGLHIDQAGTGYVMTASSGTLAQAVSGPFDINVAGVNSLAFTTQPTSTTVGTPLANVAVTTYDAFNNPVPGVTLSLTRDPGSVPMGTATATNSSGVATFTGLGSITQVGTYTLTASDGTHTVTSNSFNITPAAANHLAFTTQPTNTTAGVSMAAPVQVTVYDQYNNPVSGTSVTLTRDPGGAVIGPVTSNASGVASFTIPIITQTGSYILTATSGSMMVYSNPFSVSAAAANHLAFTTQPTDTTAGQVMTPGVVVQALDPYNNLDTSFTGAITLAPNPATFTITGTNPVNAVAGTATFSTLRVNQAGTGYQLHATSGTLVAADSSPFDITVGAVSKLGFVQQPTNARVGSAISPAITVVVQDASGNTITTDNTTQITLAITGGTGTSGATLSGTLTATVSSGVATFGNLSIDRVGTGYQLHATGGTLAAADSSPFDITAGTASKLGFIQQPTNATAGSAIAPAISVVVQDAGGNTITTDNTTQITLAMGINPSGGTLAGMATATVVNGVATFGNLSIDKVGTGYQLHATSGTLAAADSSPFDITVGTASKLGFVQQPTNATVGSAISPAITVAVQDASGNTITTDNATQITLAITGGTGTGGAMLSGTLTATVSSGVATFGNLSIDEVGTGYTLTASSNPSYTGAASSTFNITAGAASRLGFVQQPTNATAGSAILPAITVAVQDVGGNTITTDNTTQVTLAMGTNPSGGTLAGTAMATVVNGVATFGNLSIDKAGTGYTLTVSSNPSYTGTTSSTFNVVANTGAQLMFTLQPLNTTAGAVIAVQVTAQDGNGNTDTAFTGPITMAIGANPGGGTLGGTTTVNAAAGVANFTTLTIDRVGTGYILIASSAGLTDATSNPFNINAGTASRLAFTVQPSSVYLSVAVTPAVKVSVLDASGNTITSDNATQITLTFGANPGVATLSGNGPVTVVNGVATFSTLKVDKEGSGYTLVATSNPANAPATSAAFNVTQPAEPSISPTEVPAYVFACDFSGKTYPYFHGTVPAGAAPEGTNLYCGPLTDPAQYGVTDRPVLYAMEIAAFGPNRSVARLNSPITVCLQGQGQFLYRDATGMPRVVTEIPSWVEGNFTCAQISNAGTIVLAAGTPTLTTRPPVSAPLQPLGACFVTTTAIINLRDTPSTTGAVLNLVPYQTMMKATARQGDWFQVIYRDNQGWVSAQFVQTDGYCGQ